MKSAVAAVIAVSPGIRIIMMDMGAYLGFVACRIIMRISDHTQSITENGYDKPCDEYVAKHKYRVQFI